MADISAAQDQLAAETRQLLPPLPAQDEASWLRQSRLQALEGLARDGLPGNRHERWKYSSLRRLERDSLGREETPESVSSAWLEQQLGGLAGLQRWVFVDGRLDAGLSAPGALPEGLMVGTLDADWSDEQALPELDGDADLGLARLAAAGVAGGWRLETRAGTRVEQTLLLVHVQRSGQAASWRGRVRLGRDSHLQVIEVQLSLDDTSVSWSSALLDIKLEQGARLGWNRAQLCGPGGQAASRVRARLAQGSELNGFNMDLGGRWMRSDVLVQLDGEAARCRIGGVMVLDEERHVDQHVDVEHRAMNCQSEQICRGVATGPGRGVYNTRVLVAEGADGSDARQSSKNLMLTPRAEIDTKPELEIYADEVTASHGATVGQLDESALFYLVARGIPREQARAMLVSAFCSEALERCLAGEHAGWFERRLAKALTIEELEASATGAEAAE